MQIQTCLYCGLSVTSYKVLMSPRCLNCHPAGDVPFQGDDSHLHTMFPKRGIDGKGVLAMKCANCHQPENTPGLHTPPGNPNWHLPPANMKMVFEGKSPRQLAKQMVDPNQNGHKNMQQLIEHADDGLVIARELLTVVREPLQMAILPPLNSEWQDKTTTSGVRVKNQQRPTGAHLKVSLNLTMKA